MFRYAPAPDSDGHDAARPFPLQALREGRFLVFTVAAILGYGAFEAVIVHRVARFTEAGFAVATVSGWAAVSGLVSIPGRYVLPSLARRMDGTLVFAGVLGVMAVSLVPAVDGTQSWQLAAYFLAYGAVLGAVMPLRTVVMADWYARATLGRLMGVQAAVVAVARASGPALTGFAYDRVGGYGPPVIALVVALSVAAVLAVISARGSPRRAPAR